MPFFTYFEAVAIFLSLFGDNYCCSELNGTSGVKTILKGILIECSSKYNTKLSAEKNCVSYLTISIKSDPSLHTNKLRQFLTLDQIYVANRFSTAKLVSPYVIEISRGEPLTMCPLEYVKSVTAEELENEFDTVDDNLYKNSRREETYRFLLDEESKTKFISNSMKQNTSKECSNNGKSYYRYETTGGHENMNCKTAKRYSVFNTNLPIPFLMTKVKIFQKRYSTWWKLAPSVTVDSYSGLYINDDLSVWFKYHMNIFQLSKSVNRLKNFKLLLPSRNNPENLNMFYFPRNLLEEGGFQSYQLNPSEEPQTILKAKQSPEMKATTFLESCPYNSSILCVNILDDVVAGYSIKIRLPFVENAYIKPMAYKVKIVNVVTDATVKDTVKISLNLVNEGFEVYGFAVNVDCLGRIIINQTYNTVELVPHVGAKMDFILPFIFKNSKQASKKAYCKIQVKALSEISTKRHLNQQKYAQMGAQDLQNLRTVTARKITVLPHQRCLCVWKCGCHCLAKLETNVDYNVCQEMDSPSQLKAGLLINSNYYELNEKDSDDAHNNIYSSIFDCFQFAVLIVLFMGVLGFSKAILGTCIPFVDKWGYDFLQPGYKYVDSSKFRHFVINLFYFILLPFLICCNCFTPSAEDLLISNSESFLTKMYLYVYEVFYDVPSIIIIEEK